VWKAQEANESIEDVSEDSTNQLNIEIQVAGARGGMYKEYRHIMQFKTP
jgi:hypothetical protein